MTALIQKYTSQPRRRQRGIAMVEFVIAAPVVLFITLCIAEMGLAILQYNNLTKAVRDGGRHLATEAIPSGSAINLTAETREEVANLIVFGTLASSDSSTPLVRGLETGDVQIFARSDDPSLGIEDLRVEVAHTYEPFLIGGIPEVFSRDGGTIGNVLTMEAQLVVRALSSEG